MSCKQCGINITGEFVCITVLGGLLDKRNNSTESKTIKPDCMLDVTVHSDEHELYLTTDLFNKFDNPDGGEIGSWAKQAESYFCSKACLKEWFNNIIDDIPVDIRRKK